MLKGKDFLSVQELSVRDIRQIFKKATAFKKHPFGGQLRNKTLVMLFEKPSTRTRVSFEVAIAHLGGDSVFLPSLESQLSRGESVPDTARVLSRYCDGIIARLFSHSDMLTLAQYSSVPVINTLTDLLHPCQALADLFTVLEKKKKLRGLRFAYVGDGNNNVCHSLMHACSKLGVDMVVSAPKRYEPQKTIIADFQKNAKVSKAHFEIIEDPKKAVQGADVLYTDSWVSMGEEKEAKKRLGIFRGYQVDKNLLSLAKKDCIVMHDLPAHRGFEITSEVMDGPQAAIWDQAENRLHVQKALLAMIFKEL